MRPFQPIAIVGQGCVLPEAFSPEDLWTLVREGRSAISRVSAGAWALPDGRISPELRSEIGSELGGYVRGFERVFDPRKFDVPRCEALDPVFQWTLYAAREALRSAGLEDGARHPRGIVVLGNLSYPVPKLVELAFETWDGQGTRSGDPRNRFMSGLPAQITASACGFGLGGFALDAACASSLYAIKLACDRLEEGSADIALAGGVNHAEGLFLHLGFTALSAESPSGRSRPFHREADGLVPAHGAALVVLKRLSDAEAAGERILGVIRGIGLSNDGRGRGLLVPSEEGQVRAMRAAYAMSGLSPRDISLVECHATGTPVGDATEVRSMLRVFEGARDLPIGSLKSNLGHLITASGAAGLIKVLAAMEAGVRPATLHAEEPIRELSGGPLRLLHAGEPWPSDGPRRAALNNFGFGGNNAHLIVEQWSGALSGSRARSPVRAEAEERVAPEALSEPIVIVAQAVIAGARANLAAFEGALFDAPEAPLDPKGARARDFELDVARLRFPPSDLKVALTQQTLLLRTALDLDEVLRALPKERTALIVGMQCDAEVARCSLRWRRAGASGFPATDGPLTAPVVLGCMPNIVANRLGSLLEFEQATFTVSAEEASGTLALALGARSLRHHEVDAAVVGAVDLSCEPVHTHAAAQVLPTDRQVPGDAALLLVLKRSSDARRAGDRVLATLVEAEEARPGAQIRLGPGASGLAPWFGHAHAASGLLSVAAAVAACRRRALPPRPGRPAMPLLPAAGERHVDVEVQALGGMSTRARLRAAEGSERLGEQTRLAVYGASDMDGLLRALASGERRSARVSDVRLAIVANGEQELAAKAARAHERLRTLTPALGITGLEEGVYFGAGERIGELAFVFTGPAGAYPGMGRELALAMPDLVDAVGARMATLDTAAGWLYERGADYRASPLEKLWGSAFLIQLHAELTRGFLGLDPDAAIGYCSGETNALFALGAWEDLDGFRRLIDERRVYTHELSGKLECVRRAWDVSPGSDVRWSALRVQAPLPDVRRALELEPRVHLTIVNTPTDVVIAGEPSGCARVAAAIGVHRTRSLEYEFVMHCPEAREYAAAWRAIHHRPTRDVPGVRFYTHATLSSYAPNADAVADALTGQAMNPIDFPALIERAWADGVRVFIEHGPHAGCTKWIQEILGSRPALALALDRYGRSSLLQAVDSVAQLVAAGVPLDHARLESRLAPEPPRSPPARARSSTWIALPSHFEPVRLGPEKSARSAAPLSEPASETVEIMEPPPRLPADWRRFERPARAEVDGAAPLTPRRATAAPEISGGDSLQRQLSELHLEYLRHQTAAHAEFLRTVFGHAATSPPKPREAPARVTSPRDPSRAPSGPKFGRRELEILAAGKISSIFGPLFEKQDGYRRQVRMPEPPLLLADRVLGIEGAPGELGLGRIWTETDVRKDAWYLHEGRMPAGILVESGQADLLLISWLGIDFLNRGERVYRLLGCELESHGELPRVGDTLRYEICVDGHAQQGEVRLFFFHYDCWVNGELRVTVRNGQAGFFTDEELANSAGVLWSAEEVSPTPAASARLAPPRVPCRKDHFTAADLDAFAAGDGYSCFGAGFERLATHTAPPRIQADRMRLIDEVTVFERAGGPWKRGYLRARLALRPDHWFFPGHFKNDPCMPGTLMFEGCVQALSVYLAALGYTIDRDGWRFEPVPGQTYPLRCRGQALPTSKEVVYEVFVDEIVDGESPTIYADLLGSVDGRKAFHCRRMGLRLVPGWPLDAGRKLAEFPTPAHSQPVARTSGFDFDYRSLIACAWGRPSEAFGKIYAAFDGPRRVARLPGPPYHFMSRVTKVTGEPLGREVGSSVEVTYDVPPDAWYFRENSREVMPQAVLLEVALQPCGWLAAYAGCASLAGVDLVFRNLDGTGTAHAEVSKRVGTLTTTAELRAVSRAGTLFLVSFAVRVRSENALVFSTETSFGTFTLDAIADQTGLPVTDDARARLQEPSVTEIDLTRSPGEFFSGPLRLPGPMLLLIDRITGLWPAGGRTRLGRIRTEKRVRPDEWFFKAHFFQDPVQPGSLGIEALLQTLQAFMLATGMGAGIERPCFEPIALETKLSWKYRGQIVPESQLVVIDLELSEVRHEKDSCTALATGSLWADGKRIYEVEGLGMRIVPSPEGVENASDREPRAPRFDSARARAYWRELTGAAGGWAGEDILFGLLDHFLGHVHLEEWTERSSRAAKPVLYVANHQVAIESILAGLVLASLTGSVPVTPAKAEHQHTWVGELLGILTDHPGIRSPGMLHFIDRSDPTSILRLRDTLEQDFARGRSALVHVEGTRSVTCRKPVTTMSSIFLDLAISADIDVVPVRFTGGLPVAPAPERLELPVGYGRQDYWLGRPIPARELAQLPFAERTLRVQAAINQLGVPNEAETPSPPAPRFSEAVREWQAAHGVSEVKAAIAVALRELTTPSEEGRALRAELLSREPCRDATALGAWRARLCHWLLRPTGT